MTRVTSQVECLDACSDPQKLAVKAERSRLEASERALVGDHDQGMSTHPMYTQYYHTLFHNLSTHPLNTSHQHTPSTHPNNTPSQHTPAHPPTHTHTLNTPYYHPKTTTRMPPAGSPRRKRRRGQGTNRSARSGTKTSI